MIKFFTCASVHTVKLGRFMMGRKKALDVFHRQPAALVHFKVAHAKIISTIEVVAGGYACLLRCFRKRFQNFPTQALLSLRATHPCHSVETFVGLSGQLGMRVVVTPVAFMR